MHSGIDEWLAEFTELVNVARASEAFQDWLDVQNRFHASARNTLLIKQQCLEATMVAGYRTWQDELDRHVEEGERWTAFERGLEWGLVYAGFDWRSFDSRLIPSS